MFSNVGNESSSSSSTRNTAPFNDLMKLIPTGGCCIKCSRFHFISLTSTAEYISLPISHYYHLVLVFLTHTRIAPANNFCEWLFSSYKNKWSEIKQRTSIFLGKFHVLNLGQCLKKTEKTTTSPTIHFIQIQST